MKDHIPREETIAEIEKVLSEGRPHHKISDKNKLERYLSESETKILSFYIDHYLLFELGKLNFKNLGRAYLLPHQKAEAVIRNSIKKLRNSSRPYFTSERLNELIYGIQWKQHRLWNRTDRETSIPK